MARGDGHTAAKGQRRGFEIAKIRLIDMRSRVGAGCGGCGTGPDRQAVRAGKEKGAARRQPLHDPDRAGPQRIGESGDRRMSR